MSLSLNYAPCYWILTIRREEWSLTAGESLDHETIVTSDSPLDYLRFLRKNDRANSLGPRSQNSTILMAIQVSPEELIANGFGPDGELLEKETTPCQPTLPTPVPSSTTGTT